MSWFNRRFCPRFGLYLALVLSQLPAGWWSWSWQQLYFTVRAIFLKNGWCWPGS